jgi:hypothetical protein
MFILEATEITSWIKGNIIDNIHGKVLLIFQMEYLLVPKMLSFEKLSFWYIFLSYVYIILYAIKNMRWTQVVEKNIPLKM